MTGYGGFEGPRRSPRRTRGRSPSPPVPAAAPPPPAPRMAEGRPSRFYNSPATLRCLLEATANHKAMCPPKRQGQERLDAVNKELHAYRAADYPFGFSVSRKTMETHVNSALEDYKKRIAADKYATGTDAKNNKWLDDMCCTILETISEAARGQGETFLTRGL